MPKINRIILNGVVLDFADETARSLCEDLKTDLENLAEVSRSGDYNDLINKPLIDSTLSDSSTNAVENKVITDELNKKVNESGLSEVAFSGNYEDLERKPSIPTIINTLDSESTVDGLSAKQGKELNNNLAQNKIRQATVTKTGADGVYVITPNASIDLINIINVYVTSNNNTSITRIFKHSDGISFACFIRNVAAGGAPSTSSLTLNIEYTSSNGNDVVFS